MPISQTLPSIHQQYVRKETLAGCTANAVISFVLAYLIFRNLPAIPLWGADGIAFDLIPTAFLITLLANLVVTLLTRRRMQAGVIPRLPEHHQASWIVRHLPRQVFLRVLVLAIVMTAVLVPLAVLLLVGLDITSMSVWHFAVFKMVFSALVAGLSCPVTIAAALSK